MDGDHRDQLGWADLPWWWRLGTFASGLIIVVGDGDVQLVRSLRELAVTLEGVDVAHGRCRAFASDGRVISLAAEGVIEARSIVDIGRVRAEPSQPPEHRVRELLVEIDRHLAAATSGSEERAELRALRDRLAGGAPVGC